MVITSLIGKYPKLSITLPSLGLCNGTSGSWSFAKCIFVLISVCQAPNKKHWATNGFWFCIFSATVISAIELLQPSLLNTDIVDFTSIYWIATLFLDNFWLYLVRKEFRNIIRYALYINEHISLTARQGRMLSNTSVF